MRQSCSGREVTLEEVQRRRHKHNPFADHYVQFCLHGVQNWEKTRVHDRRCTIDSTVADIHARVELVRTMKSMLMKQTGEAIKLCSVNPTKGQGGHPPEGSVADPEGHGPRAGSSVRDKEDGTCKGEHDQLALW